MKQFQSNIFVTNIMTDKPRIGRFSLPVSATTVLVINSHDAKLIEVECRYV